MNKYSFELTSKLKDGTPIIVSDFIKDGDVWSIDEQGVKVPLFDGDHELVDGTQFVSVAGKITEIKEATPEVEVENSVETTPVSVQQEELVKFATEESVETLKKELNDLKQKFESLNIDNKIQEKFNEIKPNSILDKAVEPKKLTRKEHILMQVEKFQK